MQGVQEHKVDANHTPATFAERIKKFNHEDMQQVIAELPELRITNPKSFFQIVKGMSGLKSQSTRVKGITNEDGSVDELDVGLEKIIRKLYCPPKGRLDYSIVHLLAQEQQNFQITLEVKEMKEAIDGLSYGRSCGGDAMPDMWFHTLAKPGKEK